MVLCGVSSTLTAVTPVITSIACSVAATSASIITSEAREAIDTIVNRPVGGVVHDGNIKPVEKKKSIWL